MLLIIYSMVLLHNVVPHFHIESHAEHEVASNASDTHHSHAHSHDHHKHDSEENTNTDFFHSLGHLLGSGFHSHEAQEHLAHVSISNKVSFTKIKVCYADLLSSALPVKEILEKEKVPYFIPPPYERCLFTATPLRAPPALV